MITMIGIVGAALLVLGGIALAVFGARHRERTGVDRLRAVMDEPGDGKGREISVLAQAWSAMTAATDRAGQGGSVLTWLGVTLERAGWPLRPAEFGVGVVGAVCVAALVGAVAISVLAGLVFAVVAGIVPVFLLYRKAERLGQKADEQLPDVLSQLAASLRTGHSISQALEAAGEQTEAPLGPQFTRVVAETQVGRTLDDALVAMAERVGSTDLRWTVRAMMIQSRTGGSLAGVFEVLAEFMRDREEVRREVRALTADGRISAWVLGLLPFFVLGALLVMSPDYLLPLLSPRGFLMIGVAAGLMAFGLVLIRKMVRVEV